MSQPNVRRTDQTENVQRSEPSTSCARIREKLLSDLPVRERRLKLNGVSTAVLEGGAGSPVVLLHGPGEYGAKWLRVIPSLVTTHRVIAPDLPGYGASEPFEGPLDVERVVAWLDDLIECTCTTPPVLVGHVLGGAIAAHFASERSARLSRLVLVDTLGLSAFQPTPEFGAALGEFMAQPSEASHDRLWRRCAYDLDALRKQLGERWESIKAYNVDRARAPGLGPARHGMLEQFGMAAIPPAVLARIAVPTTLIWGRHDLATPLSTAQAASTRYGWPLHVIENAADDPPMEQPEAFLEALHSEIAKPPGGSETRAAWDAIAPGYDRTNTPTQMWLGNEGLRRAGVRAGTRFLDVAAGSGALSIPAARLGAKVVATDQSHVMLDLLNARAQKEGLEIETRVMDGHALELADESFDVVGSQFGVMLFHDMPRAIREMARTTKPGGSVLVHAYGDPHHIDFLGFFVRALQSVRPEFDGPPAEPPPLEFQLADPDRLRGVLTAAGLRDVRVETITETTEFPSGASLWDWVVSSNPIAQHLLDSLNLSSQETKVVKQAIEELVRERAGSSGVAKLTNPINIGIGKK
jgi:pimeloyl-ACP methyl ester carboxylesterase/SAM-dependent methyltransferase